MATPFQYDISCMYDKIIVAFTNCLQLKVWFGNFTSSLYRDGKRACYSVQLYAMMGLRV